MILVDTSVWIDYFHGTVSRQTDHLDASITKGAVVIGDLIFLEILQGIRNDKEYLITKRNLLALEQFELLGKTMAEECAVNYRALRKKGITSRKTADVIIATFCIEHRVPLLFADRDFMPFVDHLGLGACRTLAVEARIRLRENRFSMIRRPIEVLWVKNRWKYGPRRRIRSPAVQSPTGS